MRLISVWAAVIGGGMGLMAAEQVAWWWAGGLVVLALSWWRWRVALIVLVCFGLAYWRIGTWTNHSLQPWVSRFDRSLTVEGIVIESTERGSVLSLLSNHLPGQLDARGRTWPAGAHVQITCRPYPASTALSRSLAHRRMAACDEPKLLSLTWPTWSVQSWLAGWRATVTQQLRSNLRTDPGALAIGLIFGDDNYFTENLRQAFRRTGTTHLVALSGYNVSLILAVVLENLAHWVGRRWSVWCSMTLLLLFIVMTGVAASVVRAGLMATGVQAARFVGRPVSPWRPLGYALLLMLWQNPGLLLHDVGFQLSVLSTVGLMTFSTPLAQKLKWLPDWFSIRQNVATTLAATIATLPVTIGIFGRWSVVSVGVNAAVLPLMPLSMALSMMLVVAGALGQWTVTFFRPVVELTLGAITTFLTWAARPAWASASVPAAVGLIGAVVIVGTMLRFVYEEFRPGV